MSVAYDIVGRGEPLLLLHAGVADRRMWYPLLERLAGEFRLILPDLPGFGETLIPDREFSYATMVTDLLDELGIESPIWVVGASFGGQIAVNLALLYPERVAGLILAAPIVQGYEPGSEIQNFGEREDALLDMNDISGAVELNLRTWVDGTLRSPEEVSSRLRQRVAEMQEEAFLHEEPPGAAVEWPEPPAIERLSEITVPTLVLCGDLDLEEVFEHARQISSGLPSWQTEIVLDVAHMISMERPRGFAKRVISFISESKENGEKA